jgi:hypothetical protein
MAGLRRWLRSIDRSAWITFGVLTLAFAGSRVLYQLAGVSFDSSFLPLAQQHLELDHLEHRLLESVWYLHTQPPLFNLLLGLALKLSPFSLPTTMHLLYLALGWALMGMVYVLLRDLAVPRRAAVVVAIVICCGPTVVLYEHWPSYEYPLAVMVTGLAVASLRWARTGSVKWLATAVTLGAACVATRALFSPIWLAGIVAVLVVARRPRLAWPAVAAIGVPVLLVGGLMVKNLVLFDTPLLSSWGGWNLQRVTIDELPDDVRQRLIADGTVTPMANIPVQLGLDHYATETEPCTPAHPDIPVLADTHKRPIPGSPSTGWENFNNECYLPITREALDNAVAAGFAEPRNTARAWVGSFQIWAEPASLYAFVDVNRREIVDLDRWYRQTVLADVPWNPIVNTHAGFYLPLATPGGRWRMSLTVILGTIAAVALGGRSGWRLVRGRGSPRDAELAVIGFTVLAVTLTGNLLEIGENNRFRFVVEPVTLVVAAAVGAEALRRARALVDRRRAGPSPEIA